MGRAKRDDVLPRHRGPARTEREVSVAITEAPDIALETFTVLWECVKSGLWRVMEIKRAGPHYG